MKALDPRLVDLYDVDNPDGPDHDYFRTLAHQLDAHMIVDLGCGTGMLTVTLVGRDRRVTGVDPDAEMLSFARRRLGGDAVDWVLGDSRIIGSVGADLVVMSGNVAQAITGEAWTRTLSDVHSALRPGGTLAFESRNPTARAWEQWTREQTYGRRETRSGPLVEWMEVTDVGTDGTVTLEAHNIFETSKEHLAHTETLAFRQRGQIETDLVAAGFCRPQVWGGWLHEPVTPDSRVLVFEATARRSSDELNHGGPEVRTSY